jgi:hypothetical protein
MVFSVSWNLASAQRIPERLAAYRIQVNKTFYVKTISKKKIKQLHEDHFLSFQSLTSLPYGKKGSG